MRFRGNRVAAALIVLLVALAGVAVANARGPAGLDTSYGEGGVATVRVPEPAYEGAHGPYADAYGFASADDGSAYMLGNLSACGGRCRNGRFVVRIESSGRMDGSYAGDGTLELPPGYDYTVVTDPAGRTLIADLEPNRHTVVIRRFKGDGSLDRGFGKAGTVSVACSRCGERFIGLRLLPSPGNRILLDVNVPESHLQSRVRLFRFRENGAPDRRFGRAGAFSFASAPSLPRAVAVAADGAVLLGGAGCCDAPKIYLERVTADGKLDARFNRAAARSVGRLSRPGESLTLGAVVPRSGGGLAALGGSQKGKGYMLRLKRDGSLAGGFGKRGLVRLPAAVGSAVPGVGGAIFAVGRTKPYDHFSAYRILADGRLDPAYGGGAGLEIPLPGGPARPLAAGAGRVLVTDQGNTFCREVCQSHPAIARFLE
jgi:uncharacterized delta-60 repeat protein